MKKESGKVISGKIPIELFEELEDYCWVRRMTKSMVIRVAIKEYLARAKERELQIKG